MNKYTEEQQAVIDCKEPIIIGEALSGTGKSSTSVGFSEARRDKRILYIVFNSSMKKEAERDFKHLPNVTIKTTHGLAWAKYGSKYKSRLIMGNYRVMDCIKDLGLRNKEYEFASILLNCYNKFLTSDLSDIKEMVRLILGNNSKRAEKYADKLWDMKVNGNIQVEHNLYLKLYQLQTYDLGNDYDVLILDESQDFSRVVIDIANNANCEQKLIIGR